MQQSFNPLKGLRPLASTTIIFMWPVIYKKTKHQQIQTQEITGESQVSETTAWYTHHLLGLIFVCLFN